MRQDRKVELTSNVTDDTLLDDPEEVLQEEKHLGQQTKEVPLEEEKDCPDLPSCKGASGQWSDWSEYSATCGGLRGRTWKCIGPGDCEGLVIDEEKETCDK